MEPGETKWMMKGFEIQPFREKSPLAQKREVCIDWISAFTLWRDATLLTPSHLFSVHRGQYRRSLKCRGRDLGWSSANPKIRDPLQVLKRQSHQGAAHSWDSFWFLWLFACQVHVDLLICLQMFICYICKLVSWVQKHKVWSGLKSEVWTIHIRAVWPSACLWQCCPEENGVWK